MIYMHEIIKRIEALEAAVFGTPERMAPARPLKDLLASVQVGQSISIEQGVLDKHAAQLPPKAKDPLAGVLTSLTTDPNDPRLGHGGDDKPGPQNEVYLVLSEEERAKGFVRPVRRSYRHVGDKPKHPLRPLTQEEQERYKQFGYVAFEADPNYRDEIGGVMGTYWTQRRLDAKACDGVTTMGRELAETYARDPHFYGATYCCHCWKHLPVAEFVWEGTTERVGS